MLEKNGIYEAVVTDYTAEGQGIAHVEGCAVFLPNAIAGERVRLRIEYPRKTWASGKILEILEKSPPPGESGVPRRQAVRRLRFLAHGL